MADQIATDIVNTSMGVMRTYMGWQGMMRDIEADEVKKLSDQYTVNRLKDPNWKPDPNAPEYHPGADYRSQVQATYQKTMEYNESEAGRKDEVGKFDQEMTQVANVARQANALATSDPESAKALYRKLNNEVIYNGFTVSDPDEKGQITVKNSDTGKTEVMADPSIEQYQQMVQEYLSDPKTALQLRQARRQSVRENNMKALMNPVPVFNDKGDMLVRIDAQDPKSAQYTPYFTDMQGQRVDPKAAQGFYEESVWGKQGDVDKLGPGLQKRIQLENVDELLKGEPVFNDKGDMLFRVKRKNEKGEAGFYFVDKNAKPVPPDQAQGFLPKTAWDQQAGVKDSQKKMAGDPDAAKNWQESMKAAVNAWQKERAADTALDPASMWDWIDNFATDHFKKTYPDSKLPAGVKPAVKKKTGWEAYDTDTGEETAEKKPTQTPQTGTQGSGLAQAAAVPAVQKPGTSLSQASKGSQAEPYGKLTESQKKMAAGVEEAKQVLIKAGYDTVEISIMPVVKMIELAQKTSRSIHPRKGLADATRSGGASGGW